MDSFSELLISVVAGIPKSDRDNLLGFKIDLDHYASSIGTLAQASSKETSNPQNMLVLSALAADSAESLSDLRNSLNTLWLELAYRDLQASTIQTFRDKCIMRFVTAIEPKVLYVSGSLCIEGEHYQRLVREHEKNWNVTFTNRPVDA